MSPINLWRDSLERCGTCRKKPGRLAEIVQGQTPNGPPRSGVVRKMVICRRCVKRILDAFDQHLSTEN